MWTIIALIIALLFGCETTPTDDPKTFRVVSYNVQNLFDATFDGDEYPEYQDPKRWTERSYRMRLETVSRTLSDPKLGYPDIVVLQEVEGDRVVEDLLKGRLAYRGYRWYATATAEGSAISVAVISRHPLTGAATHSYDGGRPALEVSVETERGAITIFALHAKSQIGDYEETEAKRLALLRTIGAAAGERTLSNILICGDFNENPDAVWHAQGVQTALVHVAHPEAERFIESGSLPVTGSKAEMHPQWFYSAYLDEPNGLTGSYSYKDSWHQYDQILAGYRLFDGLGWEYDDFVVCDLPSLVDSDGRPRAWNLQILDGVSDHLPVMMTLRRR